MTPLSPSTVSGLSKHRIEALTDGIYAVAMTLLVIELKLPTHDTVHSADELIGAVVLLRPKFIAWLISFLVLAVFWLRHHHLFQIVRHVDGTLIALNIVQLGLVCLMPFSSALSGEFGRVMFSQIFYSCNMALLSILALLLARYVHRHPELCEHAMTEGAYRAAQLRVGGMIVVSAAAVAIATVLPGAGNIAFMLMTVIMPISLRVEARAPNP